MQKQPEKNPGKFGEPRLDLVMRFPLTITINEYHIKFFEQHRIYFSAEPTWTPGWLKKGASIKITTPISVEPYCSFSEGNSLCSIGAFSYTRSRMVSSVNIGRYTAIANNVSPIGTQHPLNRISMSGFDYSDRAMFRDASRDLGQEFEIIPKDEIIKLGPVIGNDVWIGENVTLARGIKIGNGAVVASNAVVTKDVPPFAIVAGNPATVKRFRFDTTTIELIENSKWWNYSCADFSGLNTKDPTLFITQLHEKIEQKKIQPFSPKKLELHKILNSIKSH